MGENTNQEDTKNFKKRLLVGIKNENIQKLKLLALEGERLMWLWVRDNRDFKMNWPGIKILKSALDLSKNNYHFACWFNKISGGNHCCSNCIVPSFRGKYSCEGAFDGIFEDPKYIDSIIKDIEREIVYE